MQGRGRTDSPSADLGRNVRMRRGNRPRAPHLQIGFAWPDRQSRVRNLGLSLECTGSGAGRHRPLNDVDCRIGLTISWRQGGRADEQKHLEHSRPVSKTCPINQKDTATSGGRYCFQNPTVEMSRLKYYRTLLRVTSRLQVLMRHSADWLIVGDFERLCRIEIGAPSRLVGAKGAENNATRNGLAGTIIIPEDRLEFCDIPAP